jgi:hypothetical protein
MQFADADLEKHTVTVGAIAATCSGTAALMPSELKLFSYLLGALNVLLLLLVLVVRLNKSFDNKNIAKPLVFAMAGITVMAVCVAGWSMTHPKPITQTTIPQLIQAAPPVPTVTNSYSTTGKNSPIINGPTAPINIGDAPEAPASAKRKK